MQFNVLVVGSGGTGTYFLKEVSRLLSSNKEMYGRIKSMVIADGDTVEEKNLSRQCFCSDDIGRNKASVMAEVLNETFGLKWKAYPHYLTDMEDLTKILSVGKDDKIVPVIVGCVDNHAARLLCEKFFEESLSCFYLDSANEFYTGESVFAGKMNGTLLGPCRSHYFKDILSGDVRPVTEISCEELNNVAPQHIFTNMMAGLQLLSAFSNLLEGKFSPGFSFFNPNEFYNEFIPYVREESA